MGRTGLHLSLAAAVLVVASPLAAGLAAAVPHPPEAGHVSLAWDQCWSEGGVAHKHFACNADTGYDVIVASFVSDSAISKFVGLLGVVEGQSLSPTLPDWWQLFNTGACRQTSLSASFDFTSWPNVSCHDLWMGLAQGGIADYQTTLFPPPAPINVPASNRLQVRVGAGFVEPETLLAGVQYYAFRLIIDHAKSTGAGACAGCSTGICISLTEILLSYQAGPSTYSYQLTQELENKSISWQCATGTAPSQWTGGSCDPVAGCSVPARNRTWGSIKALYR